MLPTSNFAFLSAHDAQLVQLGALAEHYFQRDPNTAIFKLRQFAELLCKTIAARHALYRDEREAFEETLRRQRGHDFGRDCRMQGWERIRSQSGVPLQSMGRSHSAGGKISRVLLSTVSRQ